MRRTGSLGGGVAQIGLKGSMSEEYKIVDIGVGSFSNEAALAEYPAETYSDDDSAPISPLAADMGEPFYDHDFLEHTFHESSSSDVRSRLKPHSFSSSYTASAARAFELASSPDFNTVLVFWVEQFGDLFLFAARSAGSITSADSPVIQVPNARNGFTHRYCVGT